MSGDSSVEVMLPVVPVCGSLQVGRFKYRSKTACVAVVLTDVGNLEMYRVALGSVESSSGIYISVCLIATERCILKW